jgi:hypothetical protein
MIWALIFVLLAFLVRTALDAFERHQILMRRLELFRDEDMRQYDLNEFRRED